MFGELLRIFRVLVGVLRFWRVRVWDVVLFPTDEVGVVSF